MEKCERDEADIIKEGIPYRFTFAVEYHTMTHHALCDAPIVPTQGRTWGQLGDSLVARFPPHVWHPDHWTVYEQAHAPQEEA